MEKPFQLVAPLDDSHGVFPVCTGEGVRDYLPEVRLGKSLLRQRLAVERNAIGAHQPELVYVLEQGFTMESSR